jgi:GTP-binding protein
VSYQIVLTKADKLKPPERERAEQAAMAAIARRPAAYPDCLVTSSAKRWGIAELRAEIAGMLG